MSGLLNFFAPYKLLIEIAVIGSLLAGVVYEGHRFIEYEQQIGADRNEATHVKSDLIAAQAAAAREQALAVQLKKANDDAIAREQTIKTLSAAAGSASASLRDTVAAIGRNSSTASIDALRQSTAALATVFNDCQAKYLDMAERADRHRSDTQTLIDAWPKAPVK